MLTRRLTILSTSTTKRCRNIHPTTRWLSAATPLNSDNEKESNPVQTKESVPYRDFTIFGNGKKYPVAGSKFLCNTRGNSTMIHLIAECGPSRFFEDESGEKFERGERTSNNLFHNRDFNNNDEHLRDNATNKRYLYQHPLKQEENIVELISRTLDIPRRRAKYLIHVGAVYISAFPPRKGDAAEQLDRLPEAQRLLVKKARRFLENVLEMKALSVLDSPKRITDPTTIVKTGNYIKIALHPRRVPAAKFMTANDWRGRVLYEDKHCIAIDKPAGMPTVPTADNIRDNLAVGVGRMLGYNWTTTQLYNDNMLPKTLYLPQVRRLKEEMLPYVPNPSAGWSAQDKRRFAEKKRMDARFKDGLHLTEKGKKIKGAPVVDTVESVLEDGMAYEDKVALKKSTNESIQDEDSDYDEDEDDEFLDEDLLYDFSNELLEKDGSNDDTQNTKSLIGDYDEANKDIFSENVNEEDTFEDERNDQEYIENLTNVVENRRKHLEERLKEEEKSISGQTGEFTIDVHDKEPRPPQLMYTQQRLDFGTSGCLLLSKSKMMSGRFQKLLESRQGIRKIYKVLCFSYKKPKGRISPVPMGMHTHFLEIGTTGSGSALLLRTLAYDSSMPGRKKSSLIVKFCLPVIACAKTGVEGGIQDSRPTTDPDLTLLNAVQLWEVDIELLTGRTHQIRAQLGKMGVCVVGDEMYPRIMSEDAGIAMGGRMGLQASRLEVSCWGENGFEGLGAKKTTPKKKDKKRKKFKGNQRSRWKQMKEVTDGDPKSFVGGSKQDEDTAFVAPEGTTTKVFEAGEPWWRTDSPESVIKLIALQIKTLREAGMF